MIESTRTIGKLTTTETRIYISSLNDNAKRFNEIIRSHWQIENKLHWVSGRLGECIKLLE